MEREESARAEVGPVLLLKAPSEEYRAAFLARGLAVTFVEPLHFRHTNLSELRDRLRQTHYAALVVTSPRAVDALAAVWDEAARARWAGRPVWAVGAATARGLGALGLRGRGAAGDAGGLALQLLAATPPPAALLYPAGNLRTDALETTLKEGGLDVDALTVYETARHEELAARLERAAGLSVRGLVFFSPSGVEYVLESLESGGPLWGVPRFAVGASTAGALRTRGSVQGVAAHPTPAALADLVRTHLHDTHPDM